MTCSQREVLVGYVRCEAASYSYRPARVGGPTISPQSRASTVIMLGSRSIMERRKQNDRTKQRVQ